MNPEVGARQSVPLPPEVAAAVERLDCLVQDFEQHPDPVVREQVLALLECVDTIHRPGLRRLAELLRGSGTSERWLDAPEVRLLFDLYEESEARAVEVPDASAPAPASSGGFVPLASVKVVRRPRLVWRATLSIDEVPRGEVRGLEVDGERILVAHVGDDLFAYRNACPGTPLPLHGGQVEGTVLRCPWHGCRFELRGGRRLDENGPGLGVLPIRVEHGVVLIGILEEAAA